MTQRPFIKFFTKDWRGDPQVRACTPMTRYVWLEILMLMHESIDRGYLTMEDRVLSRVIDVPLKAVRFAIRELLEKGVCERLDDGLTLVSRRMLKEEETSTSGRLHAEKRWQEKKKKPQKSAANGHLPHRVTQWIARDKPDISYLDYPPPSSSDESKHSLESGPRGSPISDFVEGGSDTHEGVPPRRPAVRWREPFDRFWQVYPRRIGKGAAERAFEVAMRAGHDPAMLVEAAKQFAGKVAGQELRFVVHPSTWLNQRRWEDDEPVTKNGRIDPPVVGEVVSVRQDDPRYRPLADRWTEVRGKRPPSGLNEWSFPKQWVEELRQ